MKRTVLTLSMLTVWGVFYGQGGIDEVLHSVEANSATLKARRELTSAQVLEAKSANNLENPAVGFENLWGPGEIGRNGEVVAVQPFDFPTAYVSRSKRAGLQAQQYGYEYDAFRQEILLQAEETCIEIIALRREREVLQRKVENARRLTGMYDKKMEAGDATILEQNALQVQLVDANKALRMNEAELRGLEKQLVNLNGGEPVSFTDTEYGADAVLPPLEAMAARYRAEAPGLLSMQSEAEAAERDIRVSRAEALPKFELGYKLAFAPGQHANGIVAGMSIPIFESRGKVKRAQAQARFAHSQLAAGQVETENTLAQLYEKAGLLRASLDEYREVLTPRRNEEMLNKALTEGRINMPDFIMETETLHQVRLSIIALERDYRLVCARILMIDL